MKEKKPILRVSIRQFLFGILFFTKMIWEQTFLFKERLIHGRRIRKIEIDKEPVFILGHYRSGTSLLYRILAADSQFGFITKYDFFFPAAGKLYYRLWKKPLMWIANLFAIKDPFISGKPHDFDMPEEEESYWNSQGSFYSVYWGFIFPLQSKKLLTKYLLLEHEGIRKKWLSEYSYFLKRIYERKNFKRLLLKSPPNTGRIKAILEVVPNAKFIYIYRNPVHVLSSMKKFVKNVHVKYLSLQRTTEGEREEMILRHYKDIMNQYEKEKNLIPKKNLIEIKYEDFIKDQKTYTERIYKSLKLPGFQEAKEQLMHRIEYEENIAPQFGAYTKKQIDEEAHPLADYINAMGYGRPSKKAARA